jgi:hypothetical protein
MPTAPLQPPTSGRPLTARIANKVWREASRPFRRGFRSSRALARQAEAEAPPAYLTGSGVGVAGFHPHQATVEPEAIPMIQRLVRQSQQFPGPIIEIGTLLGVTTTNIALAKAPQQKIITVDLYCWNPWGLTPEVHEALTSQMLHYLVKTGQVERVRSDKNEFFAAYAGPAPAMVFLDAIHDYVETKKDIEWARQAGARIISGHDYCDEFPGVKQAVDEFGGPRELGASVWVL